MKSKFTISFTGMKKIIKKNYAGAEFEAKEILLFKAVVAYTYRKNFEGVDSSQQIHYIKIKTYLYSVLLIYWTVS